MNILSSTFMRALAIAFLGLFLIDQIDNAFARRGSAGGYGSHNIYRSTGGVYRNQMPAPMMPRAVAPRQGMPAPAYPKSGVSAQSQAAVARGLPRTINKDSPVVHSPYFKGQLTKAGLPVIGIRDGSKFSIPQKGIITSRMIASMSRLKLKLEVGVAIPLGITYKRRIANVVHERNIANVNPNKRPSKENISGSKAEFNALAEKAISNLVKNLAPELDVRGRPVKGRYVAINSSAQKDLDSLPGEKMKNGQKLLPDGSFVGIHTSTTRKVETLHINRPKGYQSIKIRYYGGGE